jgi:putative DNA primase/helicase
MIPEDSMPKQGENKAIEEITLRVEPDGIPDFLKVRPQWVGWNSERNKQGKLTKVPKIAGTKWGASTTDLLTWRSFEEALEAYEAGKHDGVGFVFCSADPFVGLDFDKVRDPETGEIEPWVLEYFLRFEDRYVEVSVSGTGIHVITRGKIRGGKKKGAREIYDQDRFFCMTGVGI